MATLELTITLKKDGVDIPGTPITSRLATDAVEVLDVPRPTGGGYVTYALLDTVQALLLRTYDEAVTVRLNAQSDAGVVLQAGGLMVIFNGLLDATSSTNVTVQNASGETTQLLAVSGGA